jgi:hypothetical protein
MRIHTNRVLYNSGNTVTRGGHRQTVAVLGFSVLSSNNPNSTSAGRCLQRPHVDSRGILQSEILV